MTSGFESLGIDSLIGAPLPGPALTPSSIHLQDALEDLFQNITISLMTSQLFQQVIHP